MNINTYKNQFISRLKDLYSERELDQIFTILVLDGLKMDRSYLSDNKMVIENNIKWLDKAIELLLNHTPVQYITSIAWFYERPFFVDPSVLIPRPETEELCFLIIDEHKNDDHTKKILDIGTGSGCIPVTLSLEMSNTVIYAIDVSAEALNVAERNAEKLNAEVSFNRKNILTENLSELPLFDIIVSNPPYITQKEKGKMKANVLDFEPDIALFTGNDDALVFYKRIAELASSKLSDGGCLYFELNEFYAEEIAKILSDKGFQKIEIHKDMQGKNRMLRASWNM